MITSDDQQSWAASIRDDQSRRGAWRNTPPRSVAPTHCLRCRRQRWMTKRPHLPDDVVLAVVSGRRVRLPAVSNGQSSPRHVDAASLRDWLASAHHGWALRRGVRGPCQRPPATGLSALRSSPRRCLGAGAPSETTAQGRAFIDIARRLASATRRRVVAPAWSHPVAVGVERRPLVPLALTPPSCMRWWRTDFCRLRLSVGQTEVSACSRHSSR